MTLQELYKAEAAKPHPARAFEARLTKATGKSYHTVRAWILGKRKPTALERAAMEKELGLPDGALAPDSGK